MIIKKINENEVEVIKNIEAKERINLLQLKEELELIKLEKQEIDNKVAEFRKELEKNLEEREKVLIEKINQVKQWLQ